MDPYHLFVFCILYFIFSPVQYSITSINNNFINKYVTKQKRGTPRITNIVLLTTTVIMIKGKKIILSIKGRRLRFKVIFCFFPYLIFLLNSKSFRKSGHPVPPRMLNARTTVVVSCRGNFQLVEPKNDRNYFLLNGLFVTSQRNLVPRFSHTFPELGCLRG